MYLEFISDALKLFPMLRLIKFNEIYSPYFFPLIISLIQDDSFKASFEIQCIKIFTNPIIEEIVKFKKQIANLSFMTERVTIKKIEVKSYSDARYNLDLIKCAENVEFLNGIQM